MKVYDWVKASIARWESVFFDEPHVPDPLVSGTVEMKISVSCEATAFIANGEDGRSPSSSPVQLFLASRS